MLPRRQTNADAMQASYTLAPEPHWRRRFIEHWITQSVLYQSLLEMKKKTKKKTNNKQDETKKIKTFFRRFTKRFTKVNPPALLQSQRVHRFREMYFCAISNNIYLYPDFYEKHSHKQWYCHEITVKPPWTLPLMYYSSSENRRNVRCNLWRFKSLVLDSPAFDVCIRVIAKTVRIVVVNTHIVKIMATCTHSSVRTKMLMCVTL